MAIYSLDVLLSQFGTSSMSSSNCCYLTCIQLSQEAGKVVWYSHLFKNFPQFVVTHKANGFSIVNEEEVYVFLEFCCFFYDPIDVGILISGSSAFSKSGSNTWKFLVHILLKLSLENLEHYFASMWDECNREVVWTYFGIAFLWDWNENWSFPVLWPLLSFLLQQCPTLCDSVDCSPPSSSVHGILQARILEWVAMTSSRGSSWPRDQTCASYISCISRWVLYH